MPAVRVFRRVEIDKHSVANFAKNISFMFKIVIAKKPNQGHYPGHFCRFFDSNSTSRKIVKALESTVANKLSG